MHLQNDLDAGWCDAVRTHALSWYAEMGRKLPWRGSSDPYAVLVSEMMLVQTTVAAVIPFFKRFLERFPSVEVLATADFVEVLKLWEGLGYYRRARQLHEAAKYVVKHHKSRIPSTVEELLNLPGVGRYIAGAIASFAFDRPAAILEANTQRLLARLIAWEDELQLPRSQKKLWEASERLLPHTESGLFNQAIMDLGATVCTSANPKCLICPLQSLCRSFASGRQQILPVKKVKEKPQLGAEHCALIEQKGRAVMVQRGNDSMWGGLWEFPSVNVQGSDPAKRRRDPECSEDLISAIHRLTGLKVGVDCQLAQVRYSVTRYRMELTGFRARVLGGRLKSNEHLRWVEIGKFGDLAMASPTRRLIRAIYANRESGDLERA